MKNQPKSYKQKLDSDAFQIVVSLNEVPSDARKKSDGEPTYINHV